MTNDMTKKTPTRQQSCVLTNEDRAKMAVAPSLNAAALLYEYGATFGEQDAMVLARQVQISIARVQSGDLSELEAILMGQTQSLQSMFMNFARRAIHQSQADNVQSLFKMALKAQNQCRMTVETLANMKSPPTVFARQANIASGPQQVNNEASQNTRTTSAPAAKPNHANELLEARNGERLDTRATGAASGAHPAMATLEKGNRSAHE
jgi:hypothetical protein